MMETVWYWTQPTLVTVMLSMVIALVEQGAVILVDVMVSCPTLPTLEFVRALAEVGTDRVTYRQTDKQTYINA